MPTAVADESPPRRPGRPRSQASRDAILTATRQLLATVPLADLSIEGVAREAGVGKTTIYRWWTGKAALVLEAIAEDEEDAPATRGASSDPRRALRSYARLFEGRHRRVLAELLAAGQSDPTLLEGVRTQLLEPALAPIRAAFDGESASEEEARVALIAGAVIYRALIESREIDKGFVKRLADELPAPGAKPAKPKKAKDKKAKSRS